MAYYTDFYEDGTRGWPERKRVLTREGEAYFMQHHQPPPDDGDAVVRADSAARPRDDNSFAGRLESMLRPDVPVVYASPRRDLNADGMIETVKVDRSGRPVTEFSYPVPDSPKLWMRPYQPPFVDVMVKLNKDLTGNPVVDAMAAERAEARWWEFQHNAAAMTKGQQ